MGSKITILTPTHNDANFITRMIESVLNNDYKNWELIIIDDASTDSTEEVVKPFLSDKRIKYLKNEQNADQLCSLYKAVQNCSITGDIITLLHSDDQFANGQVLNGIVKEFAYHKDLDGVYGDLMCLDLQGKTLKYLKTPSKINRNVILSVFLGLGANFVTDVFCVRREVFFKYVLPNYIIWNTPYYINWEQVDTISLKKIDTWYWYTRGDNYLLDNKEERKAFVLQGCYRTLTELSPYIQFKNFIYLKKNFLIPNRIIIRIPRFFTDIKKNENLEDIIESLSCTSFLLEKALKAYNICLPELKIFFEQPINLMRNLKQNTEVLDFEKIQLEKKYLGMDGRRFFEDVIYKRKIPQIYLDIIEKANNLCAVRVKDEEDAEILKDVLKFLCLPLPILVKDEKTSHENILRGFKRRFAK